MRALGIHVVPYVNGRLFDPSIIKWSADAAWNHMCNSSNGPYHLIMAHCSWSELHLDGLRIAYALSVCRYGYACHQNSTWMD
jgi:hypothetical protein